MAALVLASTSGSNVCAMNEAVQEASLSELMPVKKQLKRHQKKTTAKKTTAKKTTSSSAATTSSAATSTSSVTASTPATSTWATTNSGYYPGSVVAGVWAVSGWRHYYRQQFYRQQHHQWHSEQCDRFCHLLAGRSLRPYLEVQQAGLRLHLREPAGKGWRRDCCQQDRGEI